MAVSPALGAVLVFFGETVQQSVMPEQGVSVIIYLALYLHSISAFCQLSSYLPIYLSIYRPIYLSICRSTYLPTCLPTYLPTYLAI